MVSQGSGLVSQIVGTGNAKVIPYTTQICALSEREAVMAEGLYLASAGGGVHPDVLIGICARLPPGALGYLRWLITRYGMETPAFIWARCTSWEQEMLSISECDPATWRLAPVSLDARGNKRAAILADGPIAVKLTNKDQPLRAPFGASLWQDAEGDRKNISFSCTPELDAWACTVDESVIRLASQSSVQLFGKQMTPNEVAEMYTPWRKEGKDDYPATVKCKINLAGKRPVRCFDAQDQPRAVPTEWREVGVVPAVAINSLWIQARTFGIVAEVTHARISEENVECPF
jgi:hypothetical protein